MVTTRGEVVGIVTAILNPTSQRFFVGIGFAVPIENAAAAVGVPPFQNLAQKEYPCFDTVRRSEPFADELKESWITEKPTTTKSLRSWSASSMR